MSKISAFSRKNTAADRVAVAADHIFAPMLDVSCSPSDSGLGLGAGSGLRWDVAMLEEVDAAELLRYYEQAGQGIGHDAGLARLRSSLVNLPRQAAKGLARQIARGAAAGVLVALALGVVPSGAVAADVTWGADQNVVITKDSTNTTVTTSVEANTLRIEDNGTLSINKDHGIVTSTGDITFSDGTINLNGSNNPLSASNLQIPVSGILSSKNGTFNLGSNAVGYTDNPTITINGTSGNDSYGGLSAGIINLNGGASIELTGVSGGMANLTLISPDTGMQFNHAGGSLKVGSFSRMFIGNNVNYNYISGNFNNTGDIHITGGTLDFSDATDISNIDNKTAIYINENSKLIGKDENIVNKLLNDGGIVLGNKDNINTATLIFKADTTIDSNNLQYNTSGYTAKKISFVQGGQLLANNLTLNGTSLSIDDATSSKNNSIKSNKMAFNSDTSVDFTLASGKIILSGNEATLSAAQTENNQISQLVLGSTSGAGSLGILSLGENSADYGTINVDVNINEKSLLEVNAGDWTGKTIDNAGTINIGTNNNDIIPSLRLAKLNNTNKVNIKFGSLDTGAFNNASTGIIEVTDGKINISAIDPNQVSNNGAILVRNNGQLNINGAFIGSLINNGTIVLDDSSSDNNNPDKAGDATLNIAGNTTIDASKVGGFNAGNGLVLFRDAKVLVDGNLTFNGADSLGYRGSAFVAGADTSPTGAMIQANSMTFTPNTDNSGFTVEGANLKIIGTDTDNNTLGVTGTGKLVLNTATPENRTESGQIKTYTPHTKLTLETTSQKTQNIDSSIDAGGERTTIDVNSGTWHMGNNVLAIKDSATLTVAQEREGAEKKPEAQFWAYEVNVENGKAKVNQDGKLIVRNLNSAGDTSIIGGAFTAANNVTIEGAKFLADASSDKTPANVNVESSLTLKDGEFKVVGASTVNIGTPTLAGADTKSLVVNNTDSSNPVPNPKLVVGDTDDGKGTVNVYGTAEIKSGEVAIKNTGTGENASSLNITGTATFAGGTTKVDGNLKVNKVDDVTGGEITVSGGKIEVANKGNMTVAGDAKFNGGDTTIDDGGVLRINGTTTTNGSTPLITVENGGTLFVSHDAAGIVDEEKSKGKDVPEFVRNGTILSNTVDGKEGGRIELVPPDLDKTINNGVVADNAGYHSSDDLRDRFGTQATIDINGWKLWELDQIEGDAEYFRDIKVFDQIKHIANDQIHGKRLTKVDGREGEHTAAYDNEWKGIVLGKPGESKGDGSGNFTDGSDDKLVVDGNLTLAGSESKDENFILVRREKQEKYQNNEKAPIEVYADKSLTIGLKKDKPNYGVAGEITLNDRTGGTAGGKLVVQGKVNEAGNPVSEFTVDKIVAETGSSIDVNGAILNVEANVVPSTDPATEQAGADIKVTDGKLDVKNPTPEVATPAAAIIAKTAEVTDSRLTANGTFRVNELTVTRTGVATAPEQGEPAVALASARATDLPDPVTSDVHIKGDLATDRINLVKGQDAGDPTVFVEGGNISNRTAGNNGPDIIGNGNVIATTEKIVEADGTIRYASGKGYIGANDIYGGTDKDGNKLAFSGNIIAGGDIIANQIIAANATIEAQGTTPTTVDGGTTGDIRVKSIIADGGTLDLNARNDLSISGTDTGDGVLENANGGNVNIRADNVTVDKKIDMTDGDLNIVANSVTAADLMMNNSNTRELNIVANSVTVADLSLNNVALNIADGNTADGSLLTTTVTGTTNLTNVYGTVQGRFTTGGTTATDSGNVNIKNSSLDFAEFDPYGNVTVDNSFVAARSLGSYAATPDDPATGNYLRSNLTVTENSIFGVGYTRKALGEMEDAIRRDLAHNKIHEPTGIFVAANRINVGGGSIYVAPSENQDTTGNNIVVGPHAVVAVDNKGLGKNSVAFTGVTGVNADSSSVVYITNPIKNGTITMATGPGVDGNTTAKSWSPDRNIKIVTDSALLFNARWNNSGTAIDTSYQGAKESMPKLSNDVAGIVDRLYLTPGYENNHEAGAEYIKRTVDHFNQSQHKQAAATIETPARLAAIAGAPQMTGAAHNAAVAIANQRTSFTAPNARMTAYDANSGKVQTGASGGNDYKSGVGLWVQPMYQSTNTHGMKAGNLKMDTNGALAGVAAGADVTIADTVRLGVTVNGGKGYATGSGDFNDAKNDFSFVGVGAYAGARVDQVGITADVNYTSAFNKMRADVPSAVGGGNLKSDVNSSAISVGLRGEYDIPVNDNVSIIPHVGVRHTSLKVDSYKVKQNGRTVLKADESNQSYWTFPVGVAVAGKVDTGNGWYIRPSADVGVIPAAGDIKNKSSVRFTGIDKSADVSSRIMDNWTFSGQAGVEFGNETVSFGVNYNLQASEHLTNHGIFGTFRVEF